jgi:hypothetical protein
VGGQSLPEIRCTICRDPVDLNIDLCADETGSPVHEGCYINRLIGARATHAAAEKLLDTLAHQPPAPFCRECGAPLLYGSVTFLLQDGKTRSIPLPICKNCHRKQPAIAYMDA